MKRIRDLLFSDEDATLIRTRVPPTHIERRTPRSHIVLVLLLGMVGLLGIAWVALAQSGDPIVIWRGVTDGNAVSVTLTLASSQDAKLSFGAPRYCTLKARAENHPEDYSLRDSNGGYCDRLLGGRMKLSGNAETARLRLRLIDDKGAARDTAELSASRAEARPPGK